jgi:hypothetical protein
VPDVINSEITSGATDVSAGPCAQSDRPIVAPVGKMDRLKGLSVRSEGNAFGERHLRHLRLCYMKYYKGARTHLP